MRDGFPIFLFALLLIFFISLPAIAGEVDPALQAKADAYQAFLEQWHSTGLGGVSQAEFTDNSRTALACLFDTGDSTIWTGVYLGAQALRFKATGDTAARSEVLRVAHYLHQVMEVTRTQGYIARYLGPDQSPWNCDYDDSHPWKKHGDGDYAGDFWVDHTSRDQYTGWWWGLTLAYDIVDDEDMRATIRGDFKSVIAMLEANDWNITDENGQWTGNGAANVSPELQLAWVLMTAHVTGEQYYRDLLDRIYESQKSLLWFDTFSWLNKYNEYYGFNLNHLTFGSIFRLWPDRPRLEHIYRVWDVNVRYNIENTHNAWFDSVFLEACHRLGNCVQSEWDAVTSDIAHGLSIFREPPNYERLVIPSTLPLDPFSVWAANIEAQFPWLRDLWEINPQTAEAHQVDDCCWSDFLWQRSPYLLICYNNDHPYITAPGVDFLVAYWMGVYYGLLPGGGPYGDDELIDDDTADDTSADDSTDDAVVDDTAGDDWHDDDAADDSGDDSVPFSPVDSCDDDGKKNGCGC